MKKSDNTILKSRLESLQGNILFLHRCCTDEGFRRDNLVEVYTSTVELIYNIEMIKGEIDWLTEE